MSDVRCQMSDVRCQMSDVRCQRSEVRGQRSEVRGQVSERRGAIYRALFFLTRSREAAKKRQAPFEKGVPAEGGRGFGLKPLPPLAGEGCRLAVSEANPNTDVAVRCAHQRPTRWFASLLGLSTRSRPPTLTFPRTRGRGCRLSFLRAFA